MCADDRLPPKPFIAINARTHKRREKAITMSASPKSSVLHVDANTSVQMVPLDQMYVDAAGSYIFLGGREVMHGAEGRGYQRNPYDESRMKWFETHVFHGEDSALKNEFSTDRARPIEGCLIEDGPYKGMIEITDGAGTWMCHEHEGKTSALVRVHRGYTTRERRADQFHRFDTDRLRLRNWQLFHAQLIAGHPTTVEIANEIEPLYVSGKGEGAVQNVGSLYAIHEYAAPRVLSKTAKAFANTEGWGLTSGGALSRRIDAINFLSVALVYDGGGTDADVRGTMAKYTYKVPNGGSRLKGSKALSEAIHTASATSGMKFTSAQKALLGANILAKKIGLRGDISESDLFLALQRRSGTTARTSHVRAVKGASKLNGSDLHA
jgi:hypothetical protein